MSDLKVGERARVVAGKGKPDDKYAGQVAEVTDTRASPSWPIRLRFTDGETQLFHRDEMERIDPTTPAERCALATARLREAESLVAERRAELRAAWVAAIAALPEVPHAGTFDEVVTTVAAVLGEPQWRETDAHFPQLARWGALDVMNEWQGHPMTFVLYDGESYGPQHSIPVGTLDVSLRRALTWLAERDVFLLNCP